ncbi:MAG: DUF4276 family protein [Acidobacteria bacterium]|nr:DUF4276 family protein [Acidobacteriota bacterium]
MIRLLLHVEGQTEETFVGEVLRAHLASRGYSSVDARLLGSARQRHRRGGARSWSSALRDIRNHLKQDPQCIAGTMVDYYRLPAQGAGAWPGRREATKVGGTVEQRAGTVERALAEAVAEEMGGSFDRRRFVPYVMMHEFEAMLFSDCSRFCRAIGRTDLSAPLEQIRRAFDTPEDIDDSQETAPSKRILRLLPSYEKPLMGNLGVLQIGLDTIRGECPHFNGWLELLEELGGG